MIPEDLKYTSEHEWLREPGQAEGSVRVGITDYAQDALGDIVFVQLPEVGETVTSGAVVGELVECGLDLIAQADEHVRVRLTEKIGSTFGNPRQPRRNDAAFLRDYLGGLHPGADRRTERVELIAQVSDLGG